MVDEREGRENAGRARGEGKSLLTRPTLNCCHTHTHTHTMPPCPTRWAGGNGNEVGGRKRERGGRAETVTRMTGQESMVREHGEKGEFGGEREREREREVPREKRMATERWRETERDGERQGERGWRKRNNRAAMAREKGMAREVRQAGGRTDKQTDRQTGKKNRQAVVRVKRYRRRKHLTRLTSR